MASITVNLRYLGSNTDLEWTLEFTGTNDQQEDAAQAAQLLTDCQLMLNRLAGKPMELAVREARLLLEPYKNRPELAMLYAKLLVDIDARSEAKAAE